MFIDDLFVLEPDCFAAAYSVRTILHSIQSLLNDANCDSPLNAHAAKLWETGNVAEYKQMVLRTYDTKKAT
jgi:ubiquitin-protein ligase